MSEIDDCEIKIINKNHNCVKLDKFPISGGIFPEISFSCNLLNNN